MAQPTPGACAKAHGIRCAERGPAAQPRLTPSPALGSPGAASHQHPEPPSGLRRLRDSRLRPRPPRAAHGTSPRPSPTPSPLASRDTASKPRDTSCSAHFPAGSFKSEVPPRPSSRDTRPPSPPPAFSASRPVLQPWPSCRGRGEAARQARGRLAPSPPSPGTVPARAPPEGGGEGRPAVVGTGGVGVEMGRQAAVSVPGTLCLARGSVWPPARGCGR